MSRLKNIYIISIILILVTFILILVLINAQSNQSKIQNKESQQSKKISGIVTNIWINKKNLLKLKENNITYLFVDIGDLEANGKIRTPREQINFFIKTINEFEQSNNYNFIILPYTEIILDKYSLSKEFQSNLINEYKNLINLGFNGAFIDIEKIPLDQRQIYISLIEKMQESLPSNSPLAIYTGHLNQNPNEWEWDINLYQSIASKANLIILPAYDTSAQDKESYQYKISEEIKELNKINSKAKFLLGIPTHKNSPETIENALEIYQKQTNQNSNFIGTSIFAEWTITDQQWKTYNQYFS